MNVPHSGGHRARSQARCMGLAIAVEEEIALVEAYCKEQGLFRTDATPAISLAGPLAIRLQICEP